MRPIQTLLALPLVFAVTFAPAAAVGFSVGQSAYDLCMTFTFAASVVKDKEAACRCAGETWEDTPPGYVDFLLLYMKHYRDTGGDLAKTEGFTSRFSGLSINDVRGQASIMSAELANVALACG